MRSTQVWSALIGSAFLAVANAAPAMAERALIIANHQYDGQDPQPAIRADATSMSRAFLGFGYAANRIENPSPDDLTQALDALADAEGPKVIYYAGQTFVEDGQTRLILTDGAQVPLIDVVAGLDSGEETILLLDICRFPTPPVAAATDDTEEQVDSVEIADLTGLGAIPDAANLFVAATTAPDTPCADTQVTLSDTLTERLELTGLPLDLLFAGSSISTESTLSAPFFLRDVAPDAQLSAADYAYLDSLSPASQDQVMAAWAASGITVDRAGTATAPQVTAPTAPTGTVVLTSPVKPVSTGARLAPITRQVARISAGAVTPVTVAAPTPVAASGNTSRPVPGTGNLPQPSIIVGLLEPTEASFDTAAAPSGPVTGTALEYTDVAGRRAFRDSDPELFATLVSGGAFDPPEEELVIALQTELQRMNCYTAGIDGDWGPGSRRAVARYFEEIDGAAPSQDATFEIFRAIVVQDDVTCPAPPAPTPARAPQAQPRAATTQQRQPAAQPQPAPQPAAPAAPQRTINRNTGTGIFR